MSYSSGGGSSDSGNSSSGSFDSRTSYGGGSQSRISRKPFNGARKFMYIDRRGTERYIYSRFEPMPERLISFIIKLILLLPFVLIGLFVVIETLVTLTPSKPLVPSYIENAVHIDDRTNIILNENELEKTLNEFEDLTGICPYIITVNNSDWSESYKSLEEYSHFLYKNSFSDEQHFLIVYSEPKNAAELDSASWMWEGIQGDETGRILTRINFWKFKNSLQECLIIGSAPIGEGLNNAFSLSFEYLMPAEFQWAQFMRIFIPMLVWNGLTFYALYGVVSYFIISKRAYREVALD